MRRRAPGLWLAIAAVNLAACQSGYRPHPAPEQIAAPQHWREPHQGAIAVDAHWWRALGDDTLSALVQTALVRNTDVLGAVARVDEARALVNVAEAARLPALNAALGLQAARSLEPTGLTNTRVVQPGLQASWEADLWGRLRSQVRAAALQYQASEAEREGVALGVAGATAQAYVALLALDAQLALTRATAASRAEALRLATDQARVGYISQLQLTQAQSEHEAVLQAIPELELAVVRQENAVRLLAGELPGPVERKAAFAALQLPPVPAALPSQLLARRPDIAQRAFLLAATGAGLEARRAAFLPQVSLSAQLGSLLVNGLHYDPVTVWNVGGSILAPLFTGGRLAAQVEAAAAQRDQAAFAYRRSVLTAFSEVENGLSGVDRLALQMVHAQQRRAILVRSLEFARDRYQAGYASYLEQLDAERNLYRLELDTITLRRSQFDNAITLYRALGGGWQAPSAPAVR